MNDWYWRHRNDYQAQTYLPGAEAERNICALNNLESALARRGEIVKVLLFDRLVSGGEAKDHWEWTHRDLLARKLNHIQINDICQREADFISSLNADDFRALYESGYSRSVQAETAYREWSA